MKKVLSVLFAFTLTILPVSELFASHGMGGEITWTCLANGQFKFKMKFYRDCNGITAPANVTLSTNHPVGNIPMARVQQNDISPKGVPAPGVGTCPTCASGGVGMVQENIYESAPITLAGVPPAIGWEFSWGECCRSNALNNIANPGSIGFLNRAVMYSYNGQNTNPCFDSSPYFSEKPSTIICTGYPFKYNPNAIDPELDSLVYSWGQPLDEFGAAVTFSAGYSLNSQLPSPTQNASNVAATINPSTGEISYTSFTGGYFATVVKVTAYKCNVKVAEIFREINVVLNNSCPTVSGVQNLPPDVNAPFIDPLTGLYTSYLDTVYAGDTVNFLLTATDFQFFNNGGPQTITIEASGSQFGTNFSNVNAGCIIPPCATLSPAAPTALNPNFVQSFQIAGQTTFNWVTTCSHVEGLDTNCRRISNIYNFVIKATDNYCPANASNVGTVSIVILPAPKLAAPTLRCASVNLDGSVSLSWTKPAVRDSQDTFHAYDVYASLAAGGPWQYVDSVITPYDNPISYTYTQSLANLTAMFATNAQQQSIYYYLKTRSGCRGDSDSLQSNVLRTIKLDAVLNGSNEAVLTWNPLCLPPLSSHAGRKYMIYKEFPLGTWALIDSTALLTYTDTTTKQQCIATMRYKVSLSDSSGCVSWSSIDEIVINNPNPNVVITPANPAFCAGGAVTLTCNTVGNSYLWSANAGSAVTQSINVSTTGTYTVTVTQNGGCTATGSTTVTVNANPVPVITGINSICSGSTTTFDAGAGYSTYLWSGAGAGATQTINAGTAGTYTVTVTSASGCTGTTTRTLTVNPNPSPVITGNTVFCQGASSTLNAGPGYASYNWGAGNIAQTLPVSTGGNYTVTVSNNFGCTGTTSTLVTVNPLPVPVITGTLAFCAGSNTTLNAGAGFTNYQWSGGGGANQTITVSTANTYTVTVTDVNGCVNNTSATTVVNANPIPVITGTFTTCDQSTTQIDAGAGYSIYNWSTGAGTQTINIGTAGPVAVTVTDINGCVGTANTSITVYQLPSAAISGIDTICFGQGTNIAMSFAGPGPYTYTYFDGTANQGPFTTPLANISIPVAPGANTNYTLVSVSNNNCSGTTSGQASIEVTPLPSAVISGTTAICDGDNTDLTINFSGVAPYTYSYTAGAQTFGPFTTNNNSEIINVAPGISTTYGLTATVTGFGCVGNTDPATALVTVNELPSATITGDNTVCNGTSTDLTFSFIGTGPYSYSYSNGVSTFGPFVTPNNPETVTVTPGITTYYDLITISDANCPGSVAGSVEVVVNQLPTASITGTTAICDGTDTDLTLQFVGAGPYTYSYNDGTNVFGPFTTPLNTILINVNPVTNTTYGITTVSDANCPGSGSGAAIVTVIPLPTSTLTGSTEICRGSSTNLDLVFTGVPPFEYIYSDGTTTFGPINTGNFNTTIPVSPNNNTTYNITFVTGAGCEGASTGVVDIVVNSIPAAEAVLSGNGVICFGESSEFVIDFTGIAPYTYSYTDGISTFGPFTTSSNPEVIPVTPGLTTSYSLVNMTDNKCPGLTSGVAEVIVNPLPTATVSGTPSICEGSGTSFTVGFTGTGPYTYSYFDGTNNVGPITTANNPEIIQVAPLTSTSYNVVTISDANCSGSSSGVASVTVNQIPSASITGDAAICIGQQTNLNISFVGVAPYSYTYSNGTTTVGPIASATNSVNIAVSPGLSSTYTLIAINDANCPGTISGAADVTVNPLPVPAITGDLVICDGETSTLTATPGYVTYVWSTSAGTDAINVSTPGAYGVTVTDINGCIGSTAVNFIVNQTPVISFTNDTSLTCSIPIINFTNNSVYPAGSQFEWEFGDAATSALSNPSHIYELPGTYNVGLTITTQNGCIASLTSPVDIMFFPLAEAKFIADPEVTNVFNGKVQFTDISDNAVSWLWDFNDGAKSIEKNPYHYFNEIGNYKVTLVVNNIAGCPDLYMKEIVINPFYIPNAFTPNTDGINDYFFDAGYVLDVQSYELAIFNRWGQKVYESDSFIEFWNGNNADGEPAPEGVYVYTIEVVTKGGKKHQFNGTVSLIR